MNRTLSFFLSALLSLQLASAQDLGGPWYGILDLPDFTLRIHLNVIQNDSAYAGIIDLPDIDVFGIPVPKMQLTSESLNMEVGGGNSFAGDVYPDCQGISGIWKNNEGSFPFSLDRTPLDPPNRSMAVLKDTYEKKEHYITMRDGIRLFTSVYTPKNAIGPLPILMVRTPYNSEPREDSYTQQLLFLDHLTKAGYIFAFQDVRGRYMSDGIFEDIRPYQPNKKRK